MLSLKELHGMQNKQLLLKLSDSVVVIQNTIIKYL